MIGLLGEPLERQLRQRRAAPQVQRLAQYGGGDFRLPLSQRVLAAGDEGVEALGVEFACEDAKAVPGRGGGDDVAAPERLAQARDVHLDGLGRAPGRVLAPQREREPLGADRLVGMQQQHGEHRAWFDPAKCQDAVLAGDL